MSTKHEVITHYRSAVRHVRPNLATNESMVASFVAFIDRPPDRSQVKGDAGDT